MRIVFGVLALALVVALTGCGTTSSGSGGGAATVSGAVIDPISGQVPAGNSVVALLQDGITVESVIATSGGQFSLPNIPNGSGYQLVANSQSGNFARTLVGPLIVNGLDIVVPVSVISTAELQALGVTPPFDNTTSIVAAFAQDANGSALNVALTMTVDSGAATAAGNPAVASLTPAPDMHQITVTNTVTGQALLFTNISLTGGAITVIRAVFGSQQQITLAGTLLQTGGTGVVFGGVPLTLRQNGTQVATTTTNTNFGTFTFPAVAAGMNYTIEAASATNSFVRTIFGPSNFTAGNSNLALPVYTAAQLQQLSVTAPTDQTATLVAVAQTTTGLEIPVSIQLNTTPILQQSGTLPVIAGIPAGTYTVTITNTQNVMAVALPNVTLPSGSLTMIDVAGSQLGFTSGSLVSRGKRRR